MPSESWHTALVGANSHYTATDRLVGLALAYKVREFSLEEIVAETGLGCSTVRAALPRLLAGGLIERNGSRNARYRALGEAPLKAGRAGRHTASAAESAATGVASPPLAFEVAEEVTRVTPYPEPGTGIPVSSAAEPPVTTGELVGELYPVAALSFAIETEPKKKRKRKRDLVFEALIEFSDADEKVDRGNLNGAVKRIRDYCEGLSDEQIVAEIARRTPALRAESNTWPSPGLMPHHFADWWSRILVKVKPASARFECPYCPHLSLPSAQAVAEHVARIHG